MDQDRKRTATAAGSGRPTAVHDTKVEAAKELEEAFAHVELVGRASHALLLQFSLADQENGQSTNLVYDSGGSCFAVSSDGDLFIAVRATVPRLI